MKLFTAVNGKGRRLFLCRMLLASFRRQKWEDHEQEKRRIRIPLTLLWQKNRQKYQMLTEIHEKSDNNSYMNSGRAWFLVKLIRHVYPLLIRRMVWLLVMPKLPSSHVSMIT